MTGILPVDVCLFHSKVSVSSLTMSEIVNAQLRGRVCSKGAMTVLVGTSRRLINAV